MDKANAITFINLNIVEAITMNKFLKYTLTLTLCFFSFQNTIAQDISFGIKAGSDFSNWRGKDVKDADLNTNISFHAGAFAEMPLSGKWNLESGIYISQKGFKADEEIFGSTLEVKSTSTYLDVPILAKYFVTRNYNVFVGPQASYLLNNKVVYEFDGDKDTEKGVSGFNKFDLGAVAGMGYQFDSGLLFSANYDFGLLKMDDVTNTKAYNRVVKISAGYRF